jgi:hypothetical protein
MAVTFTALFVFGAGASALMAGGPASYGALVTGLLMLGLAIGALLRARRRFAGLLARRRELESRVVPA